MLWRDSIGALCVAGGGMVHGADVVRMSCGVEARLRRDTLGVCLLLYSVCLRGSSPQGAVRAAEARV
jgi:hypothetical protein